MDNFVGGMLDLWGLRPTEPLVNKDEPVFKKYDPIQWIKENFYIPELNGPMVLYPYQEAALREAYRTDEEGKFVYSLVIWGDIKKSAKSSIAAAVAVERANRTSWGSVRIVANSREQADSRVSFYARRAVALNPRLNQTVRTKLYNIMFPNHALIQSTPMNPKTVAGGNDDFISFSELWAADNDLAMQTWTEMTLSPTKYGYSQRWVDTYAGYSGISKLLEDLYRKGMKGYRVETEIPDLELFADPETGLLMLWNTRPRLPWQTQKYYASEAAILTESEFNRIHRNMWSSSVSEFVPAAWWSSCKKDINPLRKHQGIAVAVDAAVKGDCFAVVAVSRDGEIITPREIKIWTPPKHGKITFCNEENKEDEEYPEGFIRGLIKRYNVIILGYDPYQLHSMMTKLSNENLAWCYEFGQVKERLMADKQLYDYIRDGKIVNPGNEDLTQHILHADKEDQGDKHIRIIKRTDDDHVDAAVALSMASYLAVEYLP